MKLEPIEKRKAPQAFRPSTLDRAILAVAPTWGVRRLRARAVAWDIREQVRRYEAATYSRRTKGWLTTSTGPSVTSGASIVTLRNRARDMVENNPFAARGVEVIAEHTAGMRWKITGPNKAIAKRVSELFTQWAESTACDADGLLNLHGLQRQAMRTVVQSGETLTRRRWRRMADGLEVPLQLQLIEPDYLDESRDFDKPREGRRVVNGIEYDLIGRRTNYWLHKTHPGDLRLLQPRGSQPVAARDVAHLYRIGRPGNNRGVTWFAQVMLRLRDLDEFEDAALFRQKLANAFAVFVQGSGVGEKLAGGEKQEDIEPGAIQYLGAGENVVLSDPPAAPGYEGFVRQVLHAIACGLGIPYATFTGDLSQTNFSSGRMGWIGFGRSIKSWQEDILVTQMLNPIFDWFLEAIELAHGIDTTGVKVRWTPPRREMVDPSKELGPIKEAIRSGLFSWQDSVLSLGNDPEENIEHLIELMAVLDKHGIVLDIDPRKRTANGVNADAGSGSGESEETDPKETEEDDAEKEEDEDDEGEKEDDQ